MTGDHCEHWHGLIALEVVGQIEAGQLVALDAHADQCPGCRQERLSLLPLAEALAGADPHHLDETELPMALQGSVLGFLRSADERRAAVMRRRRSTVFIASAAAAVLAVLGLVLSIGATPPGRTVALSGPGAAQARVTLTSESWGTSVQLTESDARSTSMSTLWMRTGSGTWWEAGTYQVSRGKSVDVTMACAVRASAISEIWVRDAQGRTVLRGYVVS